MSLLYVLPLSHPCCAYANIPLCIRPYYNIYIYTLYYVPTFDMTSRGAAVNPNRTKCVCVVTREKNRMSVVNRTPRTRVTDNNNIIIPDVGGSTLAAPCTRRRLRIIYLYVLGMPPGRQTGRPSTDRRRRRHRSRRVMSSSAPIAGPPDHYYRYNPNRRLGCIYLYNTGTT